MSVEVSVAVDVLLEPLAAGWGLREPPSGLQAIARTAKVHAANFPVNDVNVFDRSIVDVLSERPEESKAGDGVPTFSPIEPTCQAQIVWGAMKVAPANGYRQRRVHVPPGICGRR